MRYTKLGTVKGCTIVTRTMRYAYHSHGITLVIEKIRGKWAVGIPTSGGPNYSGTDFSAGYNSTSEAAEAVGKQKTNMPKWDKLPDIPLDCGDINNWIRRET